MITTSNYFQQLQHINIQALPEPLRKGHDLVVKSTANGTNWNNYQSSEGIKKVIDLYLQKLNEYQGHNTTSTTIEEPKQKVSTKVSSKVKVNPPHKVKKETDKKSSKVKSNSNVAAKQVSQIREEIKFIKRYVALHNKIKTPNAILSFIKALQKSIVQKLIRKTSPLANEIELIQNKLIIAYNKMKGDESFAINESDLNRLIGIAGGEAVYPSIQALKRFIGLQGKDDPKKISSFIKYLETLVAKKKVLRDDPYAYKLNEIYKNLKNRSSSKIMISKTDLSGLQGIIKACQCDKKYKSHNLGKIYHTNGKKLRACKSKTYSDASRGACSHNRGLSGVLTAEEMATRQLDLLSFQSFWFNLFGNPARNFTMMFHGEPHNGKTIFLLKLAQYLAESFGKVLYVSSEEFASPTMTKKVNEFLNPLPERLHFAENLQDPDLSDYQFIILDSVNDLGLKINTYKELRKELPDKAFVFILQHTKAGDFKGGKDWEHIAEIAGEVIKGEVNITKNRYAPKNHVNFFKQFGIKWQEPINTNNI
jgi:hypothetical protein